MIVNDEIDPLIMVSFVHQHPFTATPGMHIFVNKVFAVVQLLLPDVAFSDTGMPALQLQLGLNKMPAYICIAFSLNYTVEYVKLILLGFTARPVKVKRLVKTRARITGFLNILHRAKQLLHRLLHLNALKNDTCTVLSAIKYDILLPERNSSKETALLRMYSMRTEKYILARVKKRRYSESDFMTYYWRFLKRFHSIQITTMKKILVFFFILSTLQVAAQKTGKPLVDSLLSIVPAAKNDTAKARLYNRVFNELSFINIEEAMKYGRIGLAHVQKMKWSKGIAVFQNNLGMAYSDLGNYDSSLFHYNAALNTHSNAGDKYNMAVTFNNMGTAAQNIRADYTIAATYYFKALKLAEEMNDSTILSISLNNIARIYILQKNYLKSLEFDNKALRIRQKHGTPDEIASSMESIGRTYYNLKNIPKATEYFQSALVIYQGSGNMKGLASVWSGLSLVYGNDYRRVVEARIKSKNLWDQVNPMHPEAITNTGNLGVAYLDIVRYDTNHLVKYGGVIPENKTILLQKAADNLNAAIQLANQSGDIDSKSFFTGVLAELQELQGDFKNAFYNFKLFKETEDSIFSQENKNKIAEAESQREIDKKNSELTINKLALSNQRRTMGVLIGGLILLSTIGILLYRQSKTRKKTNDTLKQLNYELDNANKIKAKFFAILSHDLRAPVANLINFLNLQRNEPELLSKEQAVQQEKRITTSAENLLQNMEEILLWSKEQMGNFKPVLRKQQVNDLFEYIKKSFITVKGVSFEFTNPQNLALHTDENYLQTIMYNFTSNAIKALSQQVDARIEWKAFQQDGKTLLAIADNGPGISEEYVSILKDPTTVSNAKTGLGLHLIRDLAKAIQCPITVQSIPGEGTTVYLFK